MPKTLPTAGEWLSQNQARLILGNTPYSMMKLGADRVVACKLDRYGNTMFKRSDVEKLARERAAKRPRK
jgi:hypothetical protein